MKPSLPSCHLHNSPIPLSKCCCQHPYPHHPHPEHGEMPPQVEQWHMWGCDRARRSRPSRRDRSVQPGLPDSQPLRDQLSGRHSRPRRGNEARQRSCVCTGPHPGLCQPPLLLAPAGEHCPLSSQPCFLSCPKVTPHRLSPSLPFPISVLTTICNFTHTHTPFVCFACFSSVAPPHCHPDKDRSLLFSLQNPQHPAQGLEHDKPVAIPC